MDLRKIDVNPQCQIVLFKWKTEVLGGGFNLAIDSQRLSESTPIDISAYLTGSCTFSKKLSEAAGYFSFNLKNNINWKKLIKPGTWGLIYMSQDGDLAIPDAAVSNVTVSDSTGGKTTLPKPKLQNLNAQKSKLRGIIYIERISDSGKIDVKGATSVDYVITGKDFGVIYEDTEIYLNQFQAEKTVLDSFKNRINSDSTKTIDGLLKTLHNLIFAPQKEPGLSKITKLFETGIQWLWPRQLFTALGQISTGIGSFYGNFPNLLNFSETDAKIPIQNPLQFLSGMVWNKFKSTSIQPLHELYAEINNKGLPELIFRPIPWKIKSTGYNSLASKIKSFLELESITIDSSEIIDYDLGLDNHNRYNHFLTYINNQVFGLTTNIGQLSQPSALGRTFPYANQASISRHGLRRMHVGIDSFITFTSKLDERKLVQYNELLLDYWNNSIFMESGSLTILGNNDIKIGKGLYTPNLAQHENEKFYIEGYTDNFTVNEKGVNEWIQDVTVTRGTDIDALKRKTINTEPPNNNDTNGEFKGF